MLTSLSVHNLKRFRHLSISLRPLTVLTGLNGGGKTSVIQALLLTQQARGGDTQIESVHLNGPHGLQLGEASDVLHHDADPSEGISVTLTDDGGGTHQWEFTTQSERSLNLGVARRPTTPPAPFRGSGRTFLYLCAERFGPRDSQGVSSADVTDLHPGHQGEFVAQVLATLDREQVAERRLHPNSNTDGGTITTLLQQSEWWLSSIVCPVTLAADWAPQSNVAILRYGVPGRPLERIRPANSGFGITYALPVIVAALLAPRGGLLLIENPEAHLHPAGQSAMGALLARAASDGVQVIVETHSDHVINGLRRAIGVERTLAADKAIVHFFGPSDGAATDLKTIEVRSSGELTEWPKGFFDQMDDDLAALARVRSRGM
jgi:predicted ATPase